MPRFSTLSPAPYGPILKPSQCLPGRLATRPRRLELAPTPFLRDLKRLRETFPAAAALRSGELLLIGRRHLRDNNTWMHNVPELMTGRPRCTLMIHPDDARVLDLADGQLATVKSRTGGVLVPVQVTDEVMREVVSLPHGYGHDRDEVRLTLAVKNRGASLNDLTDDQELDAPSGTAAFSGVRVVVERASAT